jgi:hypothetical protein
MRRTASPSSGVVEVQGNIYLIVIKNQALDSVTDWVISDQESCSDHSSTKYVIGNSTAQLPEINTEEARYKLTNDDRVKFLQKSSSN